MIKIEFDGNLYTPEYFEKLEDKLRDFLSSEGLRGRIESETTGNTTVFPRALSCPNCDSIDFEIIDNTMKEDLRVELAECEDCNEKFEILWHPIEIELIDD